MKNNRFKKPVSLHIKGEKTKCTFSTTQNLIFTDSVGIQLESVKISDVVELAPGQQISDVETGRPAEGKFLLTDGVTTLIIERGILIKILYAKSI